ncbi:MAG: DNA-processing protein DprA [Aggregatilineales bacterium]
MNNTFDRQARSEFLAAVALALTPGVGKKTIGRLLETFGTFDAILAAAPVELSSVHGIGAKTASAIHRLDADHLTRLDDELTQAARDGIKTVTWREAAYPGPLHDLDDAPLAVFCRGEWLESDWQAVAIVGTREPSAESLTIAEGLAVGFAARGWTVVSGLARGIDAAAHTSALAAGGRTLAVLGSGITPTAIYPPEHQELAEQAIACGAVLCECHPAAQPSASALTIRNRIISGLSRAVIIIEAGATSGALHAARWARRQNRPLFAVPNGSAGNSMLLNDGVHPADSVDGIIAALTSG